MPGFPDWQEFAQHTGDTITYNVTTVNGTVTVDTIPTAQWAGLLVRVGPPNTAESRLDLSWVVSVATPTQIWEDIWDLWRVIVAGVRVPMSGGALRIKYACTVAGLAATINVTPTNSVLDVQRADGKGALSEGSLVSIGAGATQTFNVEAYRGPAYFYFRTNAATSVVGLFGFDYTGTQVSEIFRQNNVPQANTLLNLPSECVQLSITNNDAAAKNFSWIVAAAQ
jgi:hypothetical protein